MEKFSQRMGITQVNTALQLNSMDEGLKKALWNDFMNYGISRPSYYAEKFGRQIWMYCFNQLIDEVPHMTIVKAIKEHYFALEWYRVYDFLEFVANYLEEYHAPAFIEACNTTLKCELSAYRFVGKKLVPVTSEQEVVEVEKALAASNQFTSHLARAVELFADRKAPDYANSIKESISAVEATCRLITGDPKVTLGTALERLEKSQKVELHEKLKAAFQNLYWYTSDAQGIRHGLVGKADLDVEDAGFMLIACSAFINYLKAKSDKAGIQLSDK